MNLYCLHISIKYSQVPTSGFQKFLHQTLQDIWALETCVMFSCNPKQVPKWMSYSTMYDQMQSNEC